MSIDDITFLSFLDQLRASSAIHRIMDIRQHKIDNIFVIGNHSNTMFLDLSLASLNGKLIEKDLTKE